MGGVFVFSSGSCPLISNVVIWINITLTSKSFGGSSVIIKNGKGSRKSVFENCWCEGWAAFVMFCVYSSLVYFQDVCIAVYTFSSIFIHIILIPYSSVQEFFSGNFQTALQKGCMSSHPTSSNENLLLHLLTNTLLTLLIFAILNVVKWLLV